MPGGMKTSTMEFAQCRQHSLSVFSFPATPLSFHAMMHNGIDTTFNSSTSNGIACLSKTGIIHFRLATLKIGGGLTNIFQTRNMIPIQYMQGAHDFFRVCQEGCVNGVTYSAWSVSLPAAAQQRAGSLRSSRHSTLEPDSQLVEDQRPVRNGLSPFFLNIHGRQIK